MGASIGTHPVPGKPQTSFPRPTPLPWAAGSGRPGRRRRRSGSGTPEGRGVGESGKRNPNTKKNGKCLRIRCKWMTKINEGGNIENTQTHIVVRTLTAFVNEKKRKVGETNFQKFLRNKKRQKPKANKHTITLLFAPLDLLRRGITYAHLHTRTQANTHLHTSAHLHTRTQKRACVHVVACVCAHLCVN